MFRCWSRHFDEFLEINAPYKYLLDKLYLRLYREICDSPLIGITVLIACTASVERYETMRQQYLHHSPSRLRTVSLDTPQELRNIFSLFKEGSL